MRLKKPPLTQKKPENAHAAQNSFPLVSIVIPTRDKPDLLRTCIDSIRAKTDYPNYEILVVNNDSKEFETKSLLEKYRMEGIKVHDSPGRFNYSRLCNSAATKAQGKYVCFLNNDTEVLSRNWLSSMMEHATSPEVGLVGALLTLPNGSIQHAGIALGYTGVAGHPGRGLPLEKLELTSCYEASGVTFACVVISQEKYWNLGGLDESFPVGFNDVDISIRSSQQGLKNIVCVQARLLHHESLSRGRSLSAGGFFQATKDVITFLAKHNSSINERFFSR